MAACPSSCLFHAEGPRGDSAPFLCPDQGFWTFPGPKRWLDPLSVHLASQPEARPNTMATREITAPGSSRGPYRTNSDRIENPSPRRFGPTP